MSTSRLKIGSKFVLNGRHYIIGAFHYIDKAGDGKPFAFCLTKREGQKSQLGDFDVHPVCKGTKGICKPGLDQRIRHLCELKRSGLLKGYTHWDWKVQKDIPKTMPKVNFTNT